MPLKGVVLAGGSGTRLFPLTLVTNKHLLPVYDRPMIFYPLATLADMGVRETMVVVGGRSVGDVLELFTTVRTSVWISRTDINAAHSGLPMPWAWRAPSRATIRSP